MGHQISVYTYNDGTTYMFGKYHSNGNYEYAVNKFNIKIDTSINEFMYFKTNLSAEDGNYLIVVPDDESNPFKWYVHFSD